MSLDQLFVHRCVHPSERVKHTCEICRMTWEPFGDGGGWMSNSDEPFEIIGITLRYSDGSRASFPG